MSCPICNSSQTHYFASKDNYLFYRCSNCKTIFLSALPSQKDLNDYYEKDFSYRDGLINQKIIRNRSEEIIKKIKHLAPDTKTLCDVGSGYGFFLDEAKKRGLSVYGIEPSRELVEYTFNTYAISAFLGTLNEYVRIQPGQYDVVTCIHVFEHILLPKEFIDNLLKLVKPGGLLYIETPNSDSHLLYAEKENYTFLIPPHHLWLFSIISLRYLLPKNLQIISMHTYSYSEHFMGIVKQLLGKKKSILFSNTNKQPVFSTNYENFNILKAIYYLRKKVFYYLFDRTIAPLFTNILNLYHKGSILELYIKK